MARQSTTSSPKKGKRTEDILKEAALRLKEGIETVRLGRQARLASERIYNAKRHHDDSDTQDEKTAMNNTVPRARAARRKRRRSARNE